MTETQKGILAMVAACVVWGLSGLFFKALAQVPPLEVLSHRLLWTVAFLALVLTMQGRLGELRAAARGRRTLAVLCVTSVLIAVNWFIFVFAIQAGQALEASLGYYVFPLVAVALGFLVLGERFTRLQGVAMALAALAVVVLTLGLGAAPWIPLVLGTTFGGYGLLKKQLGVGPVLSVFVETALLAPPAAAWLIGLHGGLWTDPGDRPGAFWGRELVTSLLLVLSGPLMTGLPLILFSYAARRARLATVGLVQYLNPTLQFAVAVAVFAEPFTAWHGLAFPLIWAALALYSLESWREARVSRSGAISTGAVSSGEVGKRSRGC